MTLANLDTFAWLGAFADAASFNRRVRETP